MIGMRLALCGAVALVCAARAAAVTFPKPEDFIPVGVPVEAEAGPPAEAQAPDGHEAVPGRMEPPAAEAPHGQAHADLPGHGEAVGHGEAHHGAHAFHRHHAAIFVGATFHEEEIGPTAGIDYEFRLSGLFGLMAMAEAVFGHEVIQMYGAGLTWHAFGPLRFALAPVLEMEGGHMAFLMRTNAEAAFHLGGISVGPSVSLDFVSGHLVPVAGLVVGKGF